MRITIFIVLSFIGQFALSDELTPKSTEGSFVVKQDLKLKNKVWLAPVRNISVEVEGGKKTVDVNCGLEVKGDDASNEFLDLKKGAVLILRPESPRFESSSWVLDHTAAINKKSDSVIENFMDEEITEFEFYCVTFIGSKALKSNYTRTVHVMVDGEKLKTNFADFFEFDLKPRKAKVLK